jgi:acyl-CoA synthetase (AMP-forming)/AMP-acid ligase II
MSWIAACDVRILNENDEQVKIGDAGEICVRAPHVMAEYWNRPDITSETLKNAWLHTGDIARADERGYMFILDRKKDMIVSGGFNIFPREVEDALSQHADVAMVAVIGVPDEKWGEAVTAVVVPREGANPDPIELIGLVKARKGSAHAPKQIKFVRELPMTGVGRGGQEGFARKLLGRPRANGRMIFSGVSEALKRFIKSRGSLAAPRPLPYRVFHIRVGRIGWVMIGSSLTLHRSSTC